MIERPYSNAELADLANEIYAKHRLSEHSAFHVPCSHRYRVKRGGRKEQYIIDNGPILDDQTCSVCFKIRTSGSQPPLPSDDTNSPPALSRRSLDDIDAFYKWLYRHDYA